MIVLDEHHLLAVLREFVTYYNQGRFASHAQVADAPTQGATSNRHDPVAAGAERPASRLPTCRLNTTDVLPSDNRLVQGQTTRSDVGPWR
jgi:hypothetical protein